MVVRTVTKEPYDPHRTALAMTMSAAVERLLFISVDPLSAPDLPGPDRLDGIVYKCKKQSDESRDVCQEGMPVVWENPCRESGFVRADGFAFSFWGGSVI